MPTAEELDAELDAYNKQVCFINNYFIGFILVASTQTEPMES